MSDIAAPTLTHVFDVEAEVGPPIEVCQSFAGERRVIPILGGRVSGPRLQGRVLPGANDYQIIRAPGVLDLQARYIIEAADGPLIFVENNGMRVGPPDIMERQRRGEAVDPALIYFRAVPRFETGATEYQWLMRRLFICSAIRQPSAVLLRFFEVG